MSDAVQGTEEAAVRPPSRARRTVRRILVGLGVAVVTLVALGAALYAFGGMWTRTPEMRASHEALVASGDAQPVEGRFVIPIPGCVCHSADPVLQAEHSARRIRECSQCHSRVGPP